MCQLTRERFATAQRQLFCTSLVFACFVALLATASSSFAQTIAYWRFEEGTIGNQPVDQVTSPGATPILDSSGNGYHMGVATAANAPTYVATGAPVPFGAASNNTAFNFGNTPDSTVVQQEIFAGGYTGGGVNDIDLAGGWTVEVSFMVETIPDRIIGPDAGDPNTGAISSNQSFLTKQGNPVVGKSEPPIVFRIRNDGDEDNSPFTLDNVKHLEVRGLDGSGDDWSVDSRLTEPLVPGQWYNAAVRYNAAEGNADLYLDSGSGYKFQSGAHLATSGWTPSTDDWVVGRGSSSGNAVDWVDGQVDEVRISNNAVPQQDFLYNDPSDFNDVVTYTIDETQSDLTWSGSVLGFTVIEQVAGSLTTKLGGTISAHLNGNTLTFDDLSHVDMLPNPASTGPDLFTPTLGSTTVNPGNPLETFTYPTTGEDNLAFDLAFVPGDEALVLRDAFFGLPAGSADFDGPVSGLEVRTKSSRLDFFTEFPEWDASSDINGGDVTDNLATGNLTRVLVPGISEEITIPIQFAVKTFDNDTGAVVVDTLLTGQIVAIRSLGLPGDFDADGDVDGADFLLWQQGFGTTYNATDLANWEANYGTGPAVGAGSSSAPVPEPTSLVLLGLALALIPIRKVRRSI